MKKIKLTQGKFALVDDEDFEWLSKWKWHYTHGYAKGGSNGKSMVYMHRLILGITNPKEITDHKDRNGLNNQKNNLRIVNRSINGLNRNKYKNNTSGYRGVTWHKQRKHWMAQISINKKCQFLGFFNSAKEAWDKRCEIDRQLQII